jgi:hypothetical protein
MWIKKKPQIDFYPGKRIAQAIPTKHPSNNNKYTAASQA